MKKSSLVIILLFLAGCGEPAVVYESRGFCSTATRCAPESYDGFDECVSGYEEKIDYMRGDDCGLVEKAYEDYFQCMTRLSCRVFNSPFQPGGCATQIQALVDVGNVHPQCFEE